MVALSTIRQFESGLSSVLQALDAAIETNALAEDLPFIGDALNGNATGATDALAAARTALLSGLQNLQDIAGHSEEDIEDALNAALDAAGLGRLLSVSGTASGFDVNLTLSEEASSNVSLEADLGVQGLGLNVSGSADLTAKADLELSFGMDAAGFYLDTTSENLGFEVGVDNVVFGAGASLGPLNFTATDQGTDLTGDFALELSDNDGKLRVGEAVSLAATLDATADLNLGLGADFGTAALPSVSADLVVDWDFVNAAVTPYDKNLTFGALPEIALENVTLDLGTFIENVVLPVVDAVAPVLEPIQIALDILTTDIEMLKELDGWETLLDLSGDGKINMLDLLKLAKPSIDLAPVEQFIDLAKTVVDWASLLTSFDLSEAGLNFGDFTLTGEDIRADDFDIGEATVLADGTGGTLQDALDGISGGDWDGPDGGKDVLQEMIDGAAFKLPILEDPLQAISLLFGGDADLIEVDFPEVSLSAGDDNLISIPVFLGIDVVLGGHVGATFDLGFGYSTRGITQPGASAATALNGLYIKDEEGPEATLEAGISLGAALNGVVAQLVGTGNIIGEIALDLADSLQSEPDRLYFDEFAAALGTNPFSLFDASGSITAGLSISAEVLGGDLFRLDSPRITLAGFNFDGRAELATQNDPLALASLSGGALVLNTGPLAGNRLVGSATDGDEIVQITAGGAGQVVVNIDGYSGTYGHGSRIEGDLGQGNDQIALDAALAVASSLEGNDGNDLLAGGALGDTLSGGKNDDVLFGRDGNDSLLGGEGKDLFYGGAGADTMDGGAGDDMVTYVRAAVGVEVNLASGTGQNGIAQGDSLSSIEILQGSDFDDTLTGSAGAEMIIGLKGDDDLDGGAADDTLLGSEGNDTLDGGTGADLLVGALGDDTYHVDNIGDIVDENRFGEIPVGSDGGTDLVIAALDWSIETGPQTEIENLTLTGLGVVGTGNAGDNILTANQGALSGGRLNGRGGDDTLKGSAAAEILSGGSGADQMEGFGGDDTYFIDNLGDNIIEAPAGGTDSAQVLIQSFALDVTDDIERLLLDNSVINGELVGNALDQTVQGAGGDDTLEGGLGADTYIGEGGFDRVTYRNATTGVTIDLALPAQQGGEAQGDTFNSIEEIEGSEFGDTLTGDGLANSFIGLGGNDLISGLGGDDTLEGGDGNDTLNGGDGADSLTGGLDNDSLSGGSESDTLWGGSGNDFLDGGTGVDTLVGADGDDTYVVDHALEQVTEVGSGLDLVQAHVDWSLNTGSQLNIENLTLFGAARTGTGNALNNVLTGTAGDDTLDGLSGIDTMIGGAGDDLYRVENGLDLITDVSGDDRIEMATFIGFGGTPFATSGYDMSQQAAGVEDLMVMDGGSAIFVTGNTLDNHITSNSRNTTLAGGDGADTLDAGSAGVARLLGEGGDDEMRLTFGSKGTNVVDGGTGDRDLMQLDWSGAAGNIAWNDNSNGTYYQTFDGSFGNLFVYLTDVERVDVSGGSGRDHLQGFDDDDTLHGNGGNDKLYAGLGAIDASGGSGSDIVTATLRTRDDVDLGLDFSLTLSDTQTGTVTTNAGTALESRWEGIEVAQLVTGSGNDLLDTRGVGSSTNTHGRSHYFASNEGNDHFAIDYTSTHSYAQFDAGDDYDKLTIDWGAAAGIVNYTYKTDGTRSEIQTFNGAFGNQRVQFRDVEELDITTGSGADNVEALGGRDRFVTNAGNDEILGADKGDTIHAGSGADWARLDLTFDPATETDPAEDIHFNLLTQQSQTQTFFAGTSDETEVSGLKLAWLYTGAGNDTYDARGVASSSNTHGRHHYFASNDGNDHFAIDYTSTHGFAQFDAGAGYDKLTIDWGAAVGIVNYTYQTNGTRSEIQTFNGAFGNQRVQFRDVEELDLTTGSGADNVEALGGRDRFVTNGGNDEILGADKGDTIHAGSGSDWARLDLTFDPATETDPAEDIHFNVASQQSQTLTVFAGTSDETEISGVEIAWLYTGAGNDIYDARGVASSSSTHGRNHYFASNDGDDHFAIDYTSTHAFAQFDAGAGYDKLTIDWGAATGIVNYTYPTNGTRNEIQTFNGAFGNQRVQFLDVEEIDLTTGSGADNVEALGGRDRFVTNGGNDEILGADKGDTIEAGAGTDWARLDLTFDPATETDPAEDIHFNLVTQQSQTQTYFAGTDDQTEVSGLKLAWLYTGAGNDIYDARGVASSSNTHNRSHYFASNDGDDHFAIDYTSTHSGAQFDAGAGYDKLTIDWGSANGSVSYTYPSSGLSVINTFNGAFGYHRVYFSDVEELDLTTGSGADTVEALGGRDRFVTNAGSDRIFGADKGDTIEAGSGTDWARLDLTFDPGTETDPAEDILFDLALQQTQTQTYFAGTDDQTEVSGLKLASLSTGAGNDTYDARGVASSSSTHGRGHYFESGEGNDHFALDYTSTHSSAQFVAGGGIDKLTIDWGAANGHVSLSGSGASGHYTTFNGSFGYQRVYFSDVEIFDLTGGTGADSLFGGDLADVLIGNGGQDRLTAGAGNDSVDGGSGSDRLLLGLGDDTAKGGTGNDTIEAAAGADTNVALYDDGRSDVFVTDLGNGSYQVQTATEGTDILTNIQRIRFDSDGTPEELDLAAAVNRAPVLPADDALTLLGLPSGTFFTAQATDPEGHDVTYGVDGPDGALFEMDPETGALRIAPDAPTPLPLSVDGTVTYRVLITASDGLRTDGQILDITIDTNTDPVAVADEARTRQGTDVTIDVLANDTEVDPGQTLSLTAVGPITDPNGTLPPGPLGTARIENGELVYSAPAGLVGDVAVSYTVADTAGGSATGTALITVDRVTTREDGTGPDDDHPWQSITRVFAPDGRPLEIERLNDDGTSYTVRLDYDENGVRSRSEITRENGETVTTLFGSDGLRESTTITDVNGTRPWETRVTTYDAEGRKSLVVSELDGGAGTRSASFSYDAAGWVSQKVLVRETGDIATTTFRADGTWDSFVFEDISDQHSWDTRERIYDVDGKLSQFIVTRDNGDVVTTEYGTDGLPDTITLQDLSNTRLWDTRIQTFDAAGELVSTEFLSDIA